VVVPLAIVLFDMLSLVIHTVAPAIAALVMPATVPVVFEVERWLRFFTTFPSTVTEPVIDAPSEIPTMVLVAAVEPDTMRMLFDAAPNAVLPTILLFTCDGGVALFTIIPESVVAPGAVPPLLTSMPPTWLPITCPFELRQLIPVTVLVLVVAVVLVVTEIDPFALLEPMVLPSPADDPPIFMLEPLASIPTKAEEAAARGTHEVAILAMVFPLIFDVVNGVVVVSLIPS
jgi:hypothetical protein